MSMPGFKYTLVCDACGLESDSYPLLVFPQLFHGDLWLPTWSKQLGCFGRLVLDVPMEKRKVLEAEPGALHALAKDLSGPAMTVGVPSGLERVTMTPEPICPRCGTVARTRSSLEKDDG